MRVEEIWRYPVKSLQGVRVDSVQVTSQGLDGDRRLALFDVETGFGLTARREPQLLFASAAATDDGGVRITLPDGTIALDDEALSDWLGRRVALRSPDEQTVHRYENPSDFEDEGGRWEPFDGGHGAFHDAEGAKVSLVSTHTVDGWDARRFRSNLLLAGSGEDELVGTEITVGGAVLAVTAPIPRCVLVTRPQPDRIGRDLDVLRTIHRRRSGFLAVGATVSQQGQISVGDRVRVLRSGVRAVDQHEE